MAHIRPLTMDDANELFQVIDSNRDDLHNYLPWADDIQSIQDEQETITELLAQQTQGMAAHFVICHQNHIVGMISLNEIHMQGKVADIGYWLSADARHQGIAYQALEQLTQKAFSEMNIHRLELFIATDNEPSNRLAKRSGFVLEGTKKEAELLNDGFHDLNIYGKINPI